VRRLRSFVLIVAASLVATLVAVAPAPAAAAGPVSFTILHTNDFHGQLEASGSNPGMARVAAVVDDVRTTVGAGNVLLVDAGDEMQGSLLSNLQKGEPTIATFNAMGYDAATFGNHEFDWGQDTLTARTSQATYPFVTANIVQNDTGDCATAGWTKPDFADAPYVVQDVAGLKVAFVGVTTQETPTITISTATAGLCFKDPAESIIHYYPEMTAAADVVVVLSHLGFNDGGYGYGIPVYGDKTLAQKLIDAGKPVPLIIGGHSHTNLASSGAAVVGGKTTVAQAYYSGRQVGEADLTFDPGTKATTVAWKTNPVSTSGPKDPAIDALITSYASDPEYQALINTPVGYAQTDLLRNYNGDSMMGDFVDDAIYGALNSDGTTANDVDLFLNNAGGIRTDWCDAPDPANPGQFIWSSNAADCQSGVWSHDPMLLNYGQMFTILPFGNATVVGNMTGAQILQVLNQSATLGKGAIQPAGIRYSFYSYKDANPGPQPFAWGAFDYCVVNKATQACDPLDLTKTYRVGTNEFLAPAGGDNYAAFKYMTDISYWGDMLDAVNAYVGANYTQANPYKGPSGDGMLDGRITRDGTDAPDSGSIVPITILHNNDSHGNLAKGTYVGYTQLATLIKQEELHNPGRTLLLNAGDQIQGDAMMYYFKSSYTGFASDGTPLPDSLKTNPMMAVMDSLGYDAMTLGNHEFNFGSDVFKGVLGQATFPILGANVSDSGAYGLAAADGGQGVKPYIEKDLGGIKVAILGITNHRVPNYELPSNIPGLTFSDPIAAGEKYAPELKANGDVVIALTHIGFTEDPKSVEVDKNVDTNFAAQVPGVDAIIGGHSHTNPATGFGDYKFLPTIVAGPDGSPVIINQAYRYNNYLGEVVLGVRAKAGGGYEVVSQAGQYLAVVNGSTPTPEDPATKAIVDPYAAQLAGYYNKVVGDTTTPIDTLKAYTEETNGANLQADAAVWELAQKGITDVDVHLSGAMTNKLMAAGATEAAPVTLKISDMFAGMPYENSLVVISMNGPQLKTVLERAYRNYYYYKYVTGYGGYSYYTTCMLDTNSVGRIYYKDTSPALPSGDNVAALMIGGKPVDFGDASTYYNVSTVNYLAAGSCNFNDNGVSLWPLDQIVHDTQLYVRDAVIDYISDQGTVSPAVEGRLLFGDTVAPEVTITSPTAGQELMGSASLTLDFSAVDPAEGTTPTSAAPSGVMSVIGSFGDGRTFKSGDVVELYTLSPGSNTLTVTATDYYGNVGTAAVTFTVTANAASLVESVNAFYADGMITKAGTRDSLLAKLAAAQAAIDKGQTKAATNQLDAFIKEVMAQSGKAIDADAAQSLVAEATWAIAHM
jgi:2',3'-cyclic-nucleotide 2'-phosphodiesterase (5'-nucleotidase family)